VRLAPVALLLCLTAAACGGSAGAGSSTRGTAAAPAPPALGRALLTAAGLRRVAGAYVRQPPSLVEDPDPRGPCGARIRQPPLSDGATVAFASRAPAEIFQWIGRLRPAVAAGLVASIRGDIRPGCPPYRTATPYGHPQLNRFLRALSLPPLGDQRVAVTLRVRPATRGARSVYATEIMIRDGGYVTAIAVSGLRPQPPPVVRAIAIRAAASLDRLVRGPSTA
jgi:hypothetical protein